MDGYKMIVRLAQPEPLNEEPIGTKWKIWQ